MTGRAEFAPNTAIESTPGHAVARFSGTGVPVAITELTLGPNSRARIETGAPRGGFRVHGWVDAAKVPLSTVQSVPIAAGHLTIAPRQSVSIQNVSADQLKIQHPAVPPLTQSFSAWAKCAALSLDPGVPGVGSPPGDARGFALRKDALELFDGPSGSTVGVVYKAPSAPAVLFFSTEQSGAWVHVERHADVIIDAWAKASELSALPRGELLDEQLTPPSQHGPAHLALANEPRVIRTTREVPLRAHANDADAPIGNIAPDTETYVVEIMAGWVSVLPKTLDVMPVEGGGLWAKKSDLGL
jgi:hypothetical protein